MLHHQRKPQPGEKQHDGSGEPDEIEALGTDAYRAASESLLECSKSKGLYYVRGQTRGLSDLPRTRVLIDFETGEAEAGDPQQEQCDRAARDIQQYLTQNDGANAGSTEAQIKKGTKRRHRGIAISDALRNTGKFRREGQGGRHDPYRYFVAVDDRSNERSSGTHPPVSGKESQKGTQVFDFKGNSSVPEGGNDKEHRETREYRELLEVDDNRSADIDKQTDFQRLTASAVPSIPINSRDSGTDESPLISNSYASNSDSFFGQSAKAAPNSNREQRERQESNPDGDKDLTQPGESNEGEEI